MNTPKKNEEDVVPVYTSVFADRRTRLRVYEQNPDRRIEFDTLERRAMRQRPSSPMDDPRMLDAVAEHVANNLTQQWIAMAQARMQRPHASFPTRVLRGVASIPRKLARGIPFVGGFF